MSQTLTLELSESVFSAIKRQAEAIGISPEHLAATVLERQFSQVFKLLLDEAEREAVCVRFTQHFGVLSLDEPINFDNENIDADLAREYASTHEG